MPGWGTGGWGTFPWGGGPDDSTPSGPGDPRFFVYYRLVLAARSGAGLGTPIEDDILGLTGVPEGETELRFSRVLNGAGSLEFTVPLDDPFVTTELLPNIGTREVHLYRQVTSPTEGSEVLVWAGRLWGFAITSPIAARFSCLNWFAALGRREVDDEDRLYNNVDQLDIAWDLIDFTQSKTDGALGISRGSATGSGVTRSVSYCLDQRDNIADAIGNLANADDGFDFEVEPDKTWTTWAPRRGTSTGITLDAALNVVALSSLTGDASQVSNEVTGIVGGGNCETPVTELALDTVSRSTYGLMQSNITADVRPAQLQSMAEEQLRLEKDPRRQASVVLDKVMETVRVPEVQVPDLLDYDLGDSLTLDVPRAALSTEMRIQEISVAARPGGREQVSLALDGAVV